MRTYRGMRFAGDDGVSVIVLSGGAGLAPMTYALSFDQARLLYRSWQPRSDTPDEFDWGFLGAAPGILALAIVLDATDSIQVARRTYEPFARLHVASWADQWEITSDAIATWMATSGILLEPSTRLFPPPMVTVEQAIKEANQEGWVETGWVETRALHFDPALGDRIALARQRLGMEGGPS